LCIIYSNKEIKEIETYLQQIKNYKKETISYIVNKIFKKYLVPYASIDYEYGNMFVQTNSTLKQGIAVPIILSVQTVE